MAKRRNWTREELILAFNLYCKIEFSKINYRHSQVIEISKIINRTPSAVAWKLVNFASLDPALKRKGIKGASNAGKLDKQIFEEFSSDWDNMIFESEKIRLKYFNEDDILNEILSNEKEGKEKLKLAKARINQSFFRKTILASYEKKCCITGLSIPSLLVASHIVPWSVGIKNRLDPRNGLCLNNLHDKAFDRGLITFNTNFELVLSEKLKGQNSEFITNYFHSYEGQALTLPKKFMPKMEYIKYHFNEIFLG